MVIWQWILHHLWDKYRALRTAWLSSLTWDKRHSKGKKPKNLIGIWGDASVQTYTINNCFPKQICLLLLVCMLDVSVLWLLALGLAGCTCLLKCVLQLHLGFEPVTCWGKGYSPEGPLPPPQIHLAWSQLSPSPYPPTLPTAFLPLLNTHKTSVRHQRHCFLFFRFPETSFAECGRGSCVHTKHEHSFIDFWVCEHCASVSWEREGHWCDLRTCDPVI